MAERSAEEIQKFRNENNMTVSEGCPNPILNFTEVTFPNNNMRVVYRHGFKQPTPIQAQGWPIALSGRDLIGIAHTGSGKTLGFTLPGWIHINAQPPSPSWRWPDSYVLVPDKGTRATGYDRV